MSGLRKIAVIGLGYVGLPVAAAFAARHFSVVGFDVKEKRIRDLKNGIDSNRELSRDSLSFANLQFTSALEDLRQQNFYIICVPTPIDRQLKPDLSFLYSASEMVGQLIKKGDIVVYEATVYPGATEDECLPILEKSSGLKAGVDFDIGYSPERINPGDSLHQFSSIKKVVAAQNSTTLEIISKTYGAVVDAGIYQASSIKVAEAAKAIENTQRDLNIALINELSLLFARLGLDTQDVLNAAGTKWNFLPFTPGLVGGHCIGVDPYYLTHKAQSIGFDPQVILAGRRVNDDMGFHVARECVKFLSQQKISTPVVTILGLTYKENIPDIRNTRVIDIVAELKNHNIMPQLCDCEADADDVETHFGLPLIEAQYAQKADAVILAVPHKDYVAKSWGLVSSLIKDGALVQDVKAVLPKESKPNGVTLWRL